MFYQNVECLVKPGIINTLNHDDLGFKLTEASNMCETRRFTKDVSNFMYSKAYLVAAIWSFLFVLDFILFSTKSRRSFIAF